MMFDWELCSLSVIDQDKSFSEGLSRTACAFVCDLSVLRRKKSIEYLCINWMQSWKRRCCTDAEESHGLI